MRLGLYVLGAADPAERRLVEAHLPGCADCRARLESLDALPELLSRVPREWVARQSPQIDGAALEAGPRGARAAPADGPLGRVGRRTGTGGPSGGRFTSRLACSWRKASVAAAALAGGLAAGFWLLPHAAGVAPAHQTTFSAVDNATHVHASAALTGTSWGTSIQVTAVGLPRGQLCWLVVHSRTGGTEVDGYWQASGDSPVTVPGSAAWQPSDIADVQVVTDAGVLVTIAAAPA
jgi:hypothetical protein